jgi:hypothetical protein
MMKTYDRLLFGLIKDVEPTTRMTGVNTTIIDRDWRYQKDAMRCTIIGMASEANIGN